MMPILTFALALAQDDTIVRGDLGRRLDRIVQTTPGGFWGAILVARGDDALLAKGYGFADYGQTPNGPRTFFELASASKMFTAAAILKLEMEGRLAAEDPIGRHIDGVPDDKRTISIHHLLTHTAGIDDEAAGLPYATTATRDEAVRHTLASRLASRPGERFQYSNFGYALLAAIVEIVAQRPFEEYVKANLFAPAGMRETAFINDPALDRGRASHRRAGDAPDGTAVEWHWSWGYRGMGGVVTTALDLLAWHRALQGTAVLSDAAKAEFFQPYRDDYAYGWMVQTTSRGTTRTFHAGAVAGYRTILSRYPDEEAFIAILSNEACEVYDLERRLAEALFPSGIEATLNLAGRTLTEYRAIMTTEDVRWTAERQGNRVVLRMEHGEAPLAEIALPAAAARGLHTTLLRRIREKEGQEVPAGIEAGVYTYPYTLPEDRRLVLDGLEIDVMPQYVGVTADGEEITDNRLTLILIDRGRQFWPVMVKMDLRAARELAEALRSATGG